MREPWARGAWEPICFLQPPPQPPVFISKSLVSCVLEASTLWLLTDPSEAFPLETRDLGLYTVQAWVPCTQPACTAQMKGSALLNEGNYSQL